MASSAAAVAPSATGDANVAPTLRVMRLQSPRLHQSSTGSIGPFSETCLQGALCLPDSLAVYVGETFSAYLGLLNTSQTTEIRRWKLSAQLQTPNQRHDLNLHFGQNDSAVLAPLSAVDCLVHQSITEPGAHILRIQVSYSTGATEQNFRKFYRFLVRDPLILRVDRVISKGEDHYVTVHVGYNNQSMPANNNNAEDVPQPLVIRNVRLEPTSANAAVTRMDKRASASGDASAVNLLDNVVVLNPPNEAQQYVFRIQQHERSHQSIGTILIEWSQAMGENGVCRIPVNLPRPPTGADLPILAAVNPPPRAVVGKPISIECRLENIHEASRSIHCLWNVAGMCGATRTAPKNGSLTLRWLPLQPGVVRIPKCQLIDVVTGESIPQFQFEEPLCHIWVTNEPVNDV